MAGAVLYVGNFPLDTKDEEVLQFLKSFNATYALRALKRKLGVPFCFIDTNCPERFLVSPRRCAGNKILIVPARKTGYVDKRPEDVLTKIR